MSLWLLNTPRILWKFKVSKSENNVDLPYLNAACSSQLSHPECLLWLPLCFWSRLRTESYRGTREVCACYEHTQDINLDNRSSWEGKRQYDASYLDIPGISVDPFTKIKYLLSDFYFYFFAFSGKINIDLCFKRHCQIFPINQKELKG